MASAPLPAEASAETPRVACPVLAVAPASRHRGAGRNPAIGLAILVLLAAVVGGVALSELRTATAAYEAVSEGSSRRTNHALRVQVALERHVAEARGYALTWRAGSRAPLDAAAADVAARLREARAGGFAPVDAALLDEVDRNHDDLTAAYAQMTADMAAGRTSAAAWISDTRIALPRDAARVALDALVADQEAALVTGRAAALARNRRAQGLLLALVAIVPLAGFLIAGIVMRLNAASRLILREQRDYADALIATMQDGVVVLGPDKRRLEANDRFCQMTGYSREDVIDRHVELWPEGEEAGPKAVAKLLEAGTGEIDLRLRRSDGSTLPVILTGARLPTANGDLARYVLTIKDMTQRVHEQVVLRDSERRAREYAGKQRAVGRVAMAVAAGATPDAIFALVARECAHFLGSELGLVVRFDGPKDAPVGSFGLVEAPPAATMLLLGAGGAVHDVRCGSKPVRRALALPHAVGRGVAAPVCVAGRLWGALGVASTDESRLPEGAEIRLGRFAELIAMAIVNAETHAELAARATTDALTGLPNKAAFHERLEAEVERARRGGHALSLVLVDVDLFKSVNDAYGHPVGDAVLAETARRLFTLGRSNDLLARVGGEEFAWILPDTDGRGAAMAAERARKTMSMTPFETAGTLTLSAGVCDLEQGGSPGELFRLADTALYWAKASGRDSVVCYAPEGVQVESAEGRTAQSEQSQKLGSIRALAAAIDAKDHSTRAHSGRVAELAGRLAEESDWAPERVALLREVGLVHDVGKIGVPDAVLLKDSRLTAAEYEQIKRHPALGAEIVRDALSAEQVGWVRHHHERHDGRGYPDGIAGEDIADGARLLALADAWDAMTVDRSYRSSRSLEGALEECRSERGGQFAPQAVAALERLWAADRIEDLGEVRPDVQGERTTEAVRS